MKTRKYRVLLWIKEVENFELLCPALAKATYKTDFAKDRPTVETMLFIKSAIAMENLLKIGFRFSVLP
jgi:hypothetical protein